MNLNYPKGTRLTIELKTGEKLIGQIVEPGQNAPAFLSRLNDGIFLKRQKHVSFLSHDFIKSIRKALPNEKEIDRK